MKYRNVKILKRQDSNTYYARPTINHKQIYINGKTATEVYNKLRGVYKQTKGDNSPTYYTLNSWIDNWIELYKKNIVSKTTMNDIISHRKNYFTTEMFNQNISTVTTIQLLVLINSVKYERTKQKVYSFLNDIFNKAYINNIITFNPMASISKPKHKVKERRILTQDEEVKFVKECYKHQYGYIYLFALYQGLIPAESRSISKSDIDTVKNTIRIRGTKNQYRDRVMPLFDNTKKLLGKIQTDTDLIYPFKMNKQVKDFNNILDAVKIKNFTQHDLRHTFITRCKNLNIPEHIVQSWCGHSIGSSVTSKVYTHKDEFAENQYINILNKQK